MQSLCTRFGLLRPKSIRCNQATRHNHFAALEIYALEAWYQQSRRYCDCFVDTTIHTDSRWIAPGCSDSLPVLRGRAPNEMRRKPQQLTKCYIAKLINGCLSREVFLLGSS
jgi:hypothetical protein